MLFRSSWTQVASRRVGDRGLVVGIDLKPIEKRGLGGNVVVMQGDVNELTREHLPARMEGRLFDAVISDMGPDTSGVPMADSARSVQLCHAMLDRLPFLLRTGGHATMKVYEGAEYPGMLRRAQGMFDEARGFKPKASRAESVEMFVVCRGYRGPREEAPPPRDPSLPQREPAGPERTLPHFPRGLTTYELALLNCARNDDPDRAATESELISLAAAGKARRVALGSDALWLPV